MSEGNHRGANMFAVIRVRGSVNVARGVEDTLKMLRLNRVNHCVVIPDTPDYRGMLSKASSCITWGEISQETLDIMVAKRGRLSMDERIPEKDAKKISKKIAKDGSAKDAGIKPVFRLSPPSKGYKSVKLAYPRGDLGGRGEKINELLRRMI